MALRPGEENVATLFGDIHYFYGPETTRPRHHRFDKGSYVYLFENANEGRTRIEIANNPGTDDQDAFEGYLDQTYVRYSYKQTCTVSLTVGKTTGQVEWHLPTYDPRNENMYHYKLHSLDIYFWTQKDALQFVNGIRRLLPPAQIEVLDEPAPPPQQQALSSVVKKLEEAALTDPAYGEPKQRAVGGQEVPTFAPPPISAVSATDSTSTASSFQPMAYNPAAPAAPESVRHREKTPPPEDGGLNPLAAAVAHDYAGQPFSPGFAQFQGQQNLMPGTPGFQAGLASPGFAPHGFGGHPGLQRAMTMPANGAMPSPGLASPYGVGAFPGSPGFPGQTVAAPPPPPPSAPVQGTPPVTSPGLPPPPPGGFSQYSYSNPQASAAATPQHGTTASASPYNIHQQLYRPTEGEATIKYNKEQSRHRMEENAGRLERGVTGMFKKFEKKFG